MISTQKPFASETGSALIVTLLILSATLLMGIFATSITINELQIAGTDLHQKIAFYEADGGTEYGSQLLEENIACFGFEETAAGETTIDDVHIEQLAFWANEQVTEDNPLEEDEEDPMTIRAFFYPADYTGDEPRTEVYLASTTKYNRGAAIQMAAGYEGIGKGAAGGGVMFGYGLISERYAGGKVAASVQIGWRHVVGREEDCKYK